MRPFLRRSSIGLGVTFVLIQFIPYGRSHDNPPITAEPAWNGPRTRELAKRVCFDCHSNETRWPWYSHIAPASWLLERDVREGRKHLNFSEWDRKQKHADEAAEELAKGEMPPWFYLPLHADARLDAKEKQELEVGLESTLAGR